MKYLPFLLILTLISCNSYKGITLNSNDDLKAPPGTTKISENLFVDITEVTNFHWLEYSYWLREVYGVDSDEFKASIPNTEVNAQLKESYVDFNGEYLRHPAFRDYPVVGISYAQAVNYSQWRSDRVMEYTLIHEGVIESNLSKNKDSIFTIEKYFKGEFQGYKPSKEIQLYPEYSLPDSLTYMKISHYADSSYTAFLNSRKGKKHAKNMLENCKDNKADTPQKGPGPVNQFSLNKANTHLSHLRGNVREMTNSEGEFYGLSFLDSCEEDHNKITSDANLVNSYSGFRNVCVYKKWEE